MLLCAVSVDGSLLEGIPLPRAAVEDGTVIEVEDAERCSVTPAFACATGTPPALGDITAWHSLADIDGETPSCVGGLAACSRGWKTTAVCDPCVMRPSALAFRTVVRGLRGVTLTLSSVLLDELKDLHCVRGLPGGTSSAFCKHGPLHRMLSGNTGLGGGGITVLVVTPLQGTAGFGQLHRGLPLTL
mmetsp:Transcript_126559/g.253006  ORF Transcript_126559/g.253006 Transcript_126559/m.253006 type:complete len:187 (+) Transcript_126559:1042-1602(+)